MGYKTVVIEKIEEFMGIKDEWNELNDEAWFPTVYGRWEWSYASIKCLKQESLCIIVIYELYEDGRKSRTIAIMPFYIERHGIFKYASIIGNYISDYTNILIRREVYPEKEIIKALINISGKYRISLFRIKQLPYFLSKGIIDELSLIKKALYYDIKDGIYCYSTKLNGEDPFVNVNKKVVKKCKRKINHLTAEGEDVAIKEINFKSIQDTFFSLHVNRWREQSIFNRKEYRLFMDTLSQALPSDIYKCYALEVSGTYQAFLIGYIYMKRFYHYIPTYDKQYSSNAPGILMIYKIFEQCINDGIETFDMLMGDEEYKLNWVNEELITYNITIYNNRKLSGIIMKKLVKLKGYCSRAKSHAKTLIKKV